MADIGLSSGISNVSTAGYFLAALLESDYSTSESPIPAFAFAKI
jgi:hypothetical protein